MTSPAVIAPTKAGANRDHDIGRMPKRRAGGSGEMSCTEVHRMPRQTAADQRQQESLQPVQRTHHQYQPWQGKLRDELRAVQPQGGACLL